VAHPGETIEHPVLRNRGTFIRTAAETDGELLELEFRVDPGGPPLLPHIHRLQEEEFEVLEGRVRFGVRRERLDRGPGERVRVPRGTSHSFGIVSDVPARFRVEFRPALALEDFFQALYGLGAAGRVNRFGLPNPLWVAVLMWEFPQEFFYLPVLPWWLQRAFMAPLALVGRRLGYSARAEPVKSNETAA
jgi:mannose-6-phosphate isomerase-like protein (cupin superfamily)